MAGSTMFSIAYGIKVESISDPLLVDFESAAGAAIRAALPGAFLVVRASLIRFRILLRSSVYWHPPHSRVVYYTNLDHPGFHHYYLPETC
jgi:hypothetical protein